MAFHCHGVSTIKEPSTGHGRFGLESIRTLVLILQIQYTYRHIIIYVYMRTYCIFCMIHTSSIYIYIQYKSTTLTRQQHDFCWWCVFFHLDLWKHFSAKPPVIQWPAVLVASLLPWDLDQPPSWVSEGASFVSENREIRWLVIEFLTISSSNSTLFWHQFD